MDEDREWIDRMKARVDRIQRRVSQVPGIVSFGFDESGQVFLSAERDRLADVVAALDDLGLSELDVRPAPRWESLLPEMP